MKHVQTISRMPQKATAPVDIQFIIDVLNAIITKKSASQS